MSEEDEIEHHLPTRTCPDCLGNMAWICPKCVIPPCDVCGKEQDSNLFESEIEVCRQCYEAQRTIVHAAQQAINSLQEENKTLKEACARISEEMGLPPTIGPAPGELAKTFDLLKVMMARVGNLETAARKLNETWDKGRYEEVQALNALMDVIDGGELGRIPAAVPAGPSRDYQAGWIDAFAAFAGEGAGTVETAWRARAIATDPSDPLGYSPEVKPALEFLESEMKRQDVSPAPASRPSEASPLVRCWCCKHDVPEDTTVCKPGIGTQCKDTTACRKRHATSRAHPRSNEAQRSNEAPSEDTLQAREAVRLFDEATDKVSFMIGLMSRGKRVDNPTPSTWSVREHIFAAVQLLRADKMGGTAIAVQVKGGGWAKLTLPEHVEPCTDYPLRAALERIRDQEESTRPWVSPRIIANEALGGYGMPDYRTDSPTPATSKLQTALDAWAGWYCSRMDAGKPYSGYEDDLFEALGCVDPRAKSEPLDVRLQARVDTDKDTAMDVEEVTKELDALLDEDLKVDEAVRHVVAFGQKGKGLRFYLKEMQAIPNVDKARAIEWTLTTSQLYAERYTREDARLLAKTFHLGDMLGARSVHLVKKFKKPKRKKAKSKKVKT